MTQAPEPPTYQRGQASTLPVSERTPTLILKGRPTLKIQGEFFYSSKCQNCENFKLNGTLIPKFPQTPYTFH